MKGARQGRRELFRREQTLKLRGLPQALEPLVRADFLGDIQRGGVLGHALGIGVHGVPEVGQRLVGLAQHHLEAGQIEFRVSQDELLVFEIESWTRSADRFSNVLYHHARMAKEIQLHMWISFLERVVAMSGGRMTGGIEIDTRRVEALS